MKFSWGKRILKTMLTPALKFSFVQEILGKSDFVDYRSEVYKVGKKWVADMMNVPMIRKNFVEILTSVGKPIPDIEDKVKSLNVPTLLLWAKDDKITKITSAYWLKERIKECKVYILPRYRHMAPLEKNDFYTEHILKYMEV